MFDLVVIGKGMMGAGAVRHLTVTQPDLKVAVIGPDEPTDRKTHDGVFASHYDQARITRVLDTSSIWARLAERSIEQYSIIEKSSGITFHYPVGCLRVTDNDEERTKIDTIAAQFKPEYNRIDAEETYRRYPYLSFSDSFTAWDEKGLSGYVNPRGLVRAQVVAAEKNGATIIRETATSYQQQADHIDIMTREGRTYQAKKILISAGGFTNLLLERKLAFKTRAHTILLAEIPQDEIDRLAGMPSLITKFDDSDVPSMYMLPPVIYPDGKTYIKLGSEVHPDKYAEPEHYLDITRSGDEVRDWFQSDGRADIADLLRSVLHRLIPNLKFNNYLSHPCLITKTAHGNPYIDVVVPGKVYVATGGNGSGAKSSDEMGRLGALLAATDEWDSELNREDFRIVWA